MMIGRLWNRLPLFPRIFFSSNVKSIKMAYNIFDNNTDKSVTPVLIMHGLFGSKQNWRGMGKALGSKLNRKIYCVDARNHGDSPHDENHSSGHMAADIALLMQSEGIDKVSLLGHSMGGRTVMYFALKYPQLVEKLIVVDISPISVPRDIIEMEKIFVAMKNISVSTELSLAKGRVLVERQLKSAIDNQETVDFLMLNLRKLNTGEFIWAFNVNALHANMKQFNNFREGIKEFRSFRGPVMFICGNRSNFVKNYN